MDPFEGILVQYFVLTFSLLTYVIKTYYLPENRETYVINDIRGHQEIERILSVSSIICRNHIRMGPSGFRRLCDLVKSHNLLKDSIHVTVEQQLVIFLFTLAHNVKNRVMSHTFGHSGETISRYFNQTLNSIVHLCPILMAPLTSETPTKIATDRRFAPYFQDCIGAIDGTHIPAFVPVEFQKRFRDRKGNLSQNVLAACNFDQKFTYILAGWEGSAADSRLLNVAMTSVYPINIPRGKYYLVDAGFPNKKGFLSPYRNVRYHLKEWRQSDLQPRNAKELYNLRHSNLRNVIERTFGLLKSRFKILKTAPEYPIPTQVKIVHACCLLHNHLLNVEELTNEELHELEEEESELIGCTSKRLSNMHLNIQHQRQC